MWIVFALISSFLLGIYDIFKKISLKENAVLPVLLYANLTSAIIFGVFLLLSRIIGSDMPSYIFIPKISPVDHLYFMLKTIIVGSSWIFAFNGLKNLPITIVTPIRATGPIWTITGALIIFSEKLNLIQWIGIIITLGFFYLFSLAGKKEGIVFRRNKWVFFIIIATILGATSSLYDKYLLMHHDRLAVQTWFMIYMVPFMWIVLMIQQRIQKEKFTVKYTWFIPLIGITLALADYAYFKALSSDDALVSIISALRRSSVIYSFFLGAIIFRDRNIKQKWFILMGILLGVYLIIRGS